MSSLSSSKLASAEIKTSSLNPFKILSRALKLIITQPKLLFLSAFPILISAAALFWLGKHVSVLLGAWVAARMGQVNFGFSWINQFAILLSQGVVWLLVGLSMSWLSMIVASPFNELLSESTERILGIPSNEVPKFWQSIKLDLYKSFFVLCLQSMLWMITIPFFWVPGLPILTTCLGFILVCYPFVSYPQTRRGRGIFTSVKPLFKHPFTSVVLGMVFTVGFSIPILSMLILPWAVVSGTVFWLEASKPADLMAKNV